VLADLGAKSPSIELLQKVRLTGSSVPLQMIADQSTWCNSRSSGASYAHNARLFSLSSGPFGRSYRPTERNRNMDILTAFDSSPPLDKFNTRVTSQSKDEWLTPPEIIRALGSFDLDPCAPIKRPSEMAARHFTLDDNGLQHPWNGRVWLNPPYGKETFKWIARLAEHKSGVALIFARTDTEGFHQHIFHKAHSMFFFEGRLRFYHVDGTRGDTHNAPSYLISYSEEDTIAIRRARFKGRLLLCSSPSD
jgi:hypothetical protein